MADVEEVFNSMKSAAKNIGLEINEDKTKLMRMSRHCRIRLGKSITIGTHNFETVDEFVYLDSNRNNNNDEVVKIRRRVIANKITYFTLLPLVQIQKHTPENKNKNI